MGARDPAEAVEVLDLLLKFFGDGERWVKGRLSDRRGNRCLVGALDFVASGAAIGLRSSSGYQNFAALIVHDPYGPPIEIAKLAVFRLRVSAPDTHGARPIQSPIRRL